MPSLALLFPHAAVCAKLCRRWCEGWADSASFLVRVQFVTCTLHLLTISCVRLLMLLTSKRRSTSAFFFLHTKMRAFVNSLDDIGTKRVRNAESSPDAVTPPAEWMFSQGPKTTAKRRVWTKYNQATATLPQEAQQQHTVNIGNTTPKSNGCC